MSFSIYQSLAKPFLKFHLGQVNFLLFYLFFIYFLLPEYNLSEVQKQGRVVNCHRIGHDIIMSSVSIIILLLLFLLLRTP